MKKIDWKKILPYGVALAVFMVIAIGYCAPVLDGKVLQAIDSDNWKSAAHESMEYTEQTGEMTWWTNSMFGGMPTIQISGKLPSAQWTDALHTVVNGFFTGDMRPIGIVFSYFLGFFIMLLCFGLNPWLSMIGGLAMGLSSYFFVIIPVGHLSKADALGFIAPMIGGIYAIFRKRYSLGVPVVLVFGILSITLHPQMTYYVGLLLGIMLVAECYIHISEKRWKDLGISTAVLLVCGLLLFGTKLSWWQMNQSYLKETMRGGHSELTVSGEKTAEEDETEEDGGVFRQQSGLDITYATYWSYGKAETFTLLIPNMMGGSSNYDVGEQSVLYKAMVKGGISKSAAKQSCQQVPAYWGDKKFTGGAVYVGAIVCFLFVLGMMIVPGAYKWALLIATIFSIVLAWGRNFMPLTQLFFDYFPMYNKFRAVESILVVAEITMPLLGFLGLKRIFEAEDKKPYLRPVFIAAGVTGGICLIFGLLGGIFFDFTSQYDAQWKENVGKFYEAILDQRAAMLRADAWRSLLFIVMAAVVLWLYLADKLKRGYVYALLGVLIVADMVPVDRRFFDKDNFVSKRDSNRRFAMQAWEEQILQDRSLDVRVLNLTGNPFKEARTSYRLKSIGGYSAAKLRRYQDLIDAHLKHDNWEVVNMLNTKYIITKEGVTENPEAYGNAWLVDSVKYVHTADEESAALWTTDLRHVAVADEQFAKVLDVHRAETTVVPACDREEIVMNSYAPNELTYTVRTNSNRVAVFSEIYYKDGWHLYIDEVEQPIGRVNYVLRATVIPAGEHQVRMYFEPEAVKTDKWSVACIILSLLVSLGAIGWGIYRRLR